MTNLHVKTGDTVRVLSGDDKGKTGKVTKAFPAEGKILVEGINMMKKHERARAQGQKGQTIERAMPIHVSKVVKAGATKEPKAVKTTAKPAKPAKAAK